MTLKEKITQSVHRTFIASRHRGSMRWMLKELGRSVVESSVILDNFRFDYENIGYFRSGDIIHTTNIPADLLYQLEQRGIDVYIMLFKKDRKRDRRYFNELPLHEIEERNPRWHKD